MNSKNISKALELKLQNWTNSIEDTTVKNAIKRDAMITGGAIVSMLLNEKINDYDVYFKTYKSCRLVAEYYMRKWNQLHPDKPQIYFDATSPDRVRLIIGYGLATDTKGEVNFGRGQGMVAEDGDNGIDDFSEPYTTENEENPTEQNPAISKPTYRPRFFSTNAISLSDGIQIVIRFNGSIETIHENFDFEHTKCVYDYQTRKLTLPAKSLECIINRELVYRGSKYPLTSIIRTRKFITRGWTISAGQYVKMALELNDLNLKDIEVFKDQVIGVDSAYFMAAIYAIEAKLLADPSFELNNSYLFEIIDRIF